MKYHVIDIDPEMHYAPGDEIIGTVEATSAEEATTKVLTAVGVNALQASNPADYERYILSTVRAVAVE